MSWSRSPLCLVRCVQDSNGSTCLYQRSNIRDQRSEIRDQRSEIRDQKSEIRDQDSTYLTCFLNQRSCLSSSPSSPNSNRNRRGRSWQRRPKAKMPAQSKVKCVNWGFLHLKIKFVSLFDLFDFYPLSCLLSHPDRNHFLIEILSSKI